MKAPTYLLCTLAVLLTSPASAQPGLPQASFEIYPALSDMYGYAFGIWKDQVLILGGMIRREDSGQEGRDFYNQEWILIDLSQKRAGSYACPLEELASSGLNFVQQGRHLFLCGGFGYQFSSGNFETFPYLSIIDLEVLISHLQEGLPAQKAIQQVRDERLAVFAGVFDYNGQEFFLLHGRKATTQNPFEKEAHYQESSFQGEIRSFRLEETRNGTAITQFQIWYDPVSFERRYQALLPVRIQEEIERWIHRESGR